MPSSLPADGCGSYWSDLANHGWDECWMGPPAVRARINQRVTGDALRWPIEWLSECLPGRLPFERAVSIGCGVGNFERSLIDLNVALRVTGVDLSETALEQAGRSAADSGMGGKIEYVLGDARDFLAEARGLDVLFFHESLHHFDGLPEFLDLARRSLRPGGVLYLDEYVGPSRTEWTPRDLLRWNLVYWRLPPGVRRTRVIRSPINRADPTEAIESSGILGAVEGHFRVRVRRDYGGNLLAPIYPNLLRPDQPGGPSVAEFDAAVQTLLDREEEILKHEPGFYTVVVAERE